VVIPPVPDSIRKRPRQSIRHADQYGAYDQSRSGMDLVKDEKLRDEIEENRDRQQVTCGRERASQQFPAVFARENESPKKRGQTSACIVYPTARSQDDSHRRLKNEA